MLDVLPECLGTKLTWPLPASVANHVPLRVALLDSSLNVTAMGRGQTHFRRQENTKNNLQIPCERHKHQDLLILYDYI